MFIDGNEVERGARVDTDVCIAGAGAAGLTLARELAGGPWSVCLLESGGFELDDATHDLSRGERAGHPYYPLETTRLRYFGGTTNHWAGGSHPLEPADFQPRPWVPYSGWPFDRAHLDPYYERAHEVCGLGSYQYELEPWADRLGPALPFPATGVVTRVMRRRPYRFAEAYRGIIADPPNIRGFLRSNLVHIALDSDGRSVAGLSVRTLAGNEFRIRPRVCVLAMGAIENARLLLHSDDVHTSGIGNDRDLVGRTFMEHPKTIASVVLTPDRDPPVGLYRGGPSGEAEDERIEGFLTLAPELLARERLLGVKAYVRPSALSGEELAGEIRALMGGAEDRPLLQRLAHALSGADDMSHYLYRRLFKGRDGLAGLRIETFVEQAPSPDSRVELSRERDALGMRRVRVTWRFGEQEVRTIRAANERLAAAFGAAGLGRVKLQPEDGPAGWRASIRGDWHQMGTTRMNDDPRRGVVDAACRVHGVDNLFVASGSVFPTVGVSNPTLTIVALTLRLADHLRDLVLPRAAIDVDRAGTLSDGRPL